MNRAIQIMLFAGLAAAPSAGNAVAGRGGGGGFHGGGGGGFHGGGGDGFHGGGYDSVSRSSMGHTPSFNAPRTDFRPASTPQHFGTANTVDRSTFANRTSPNLRPATRPSTGVRPGNFAPKQDWARHDWYHGDWHDHWDHPWNRWPYGWFGAGVAWGLAATTPWSWGYCSYDNPYCSAPIVVEGTTIDYSQPIAAAVAPEQLADQTPPSDEASQLLDTARDAFLQGDYQTALSQADRAIAKNPADPLAHEFRSLACFALKQYKEAAAGAYAVLSAGPGWDWTTLSGFYPDTEVYAQQLHALEQYIDAHPNQPDARFLLAYHYLTCGHTAAAARQLKAVVSLSPKDQLSAQLLASLTAPQGVESPQPNAPPAKPVDAASLVGDWKARQPDGSTVALRLADDSTYTWRFTRQGKTEDHNGTYTLADNLLILKQGNTPAMVGQVALVGDNDLNFKLANDNPSDPGLTFRK